MYVTKRGKSMSTALHLAVVVHNVAPDMASKTRRTAAAHRALVERVLSLHQEGDLTHEEIATLCGISRSNVTYIISHYGGKAEVSASDLIAEIRRISGLTYEQIADRTGLNKHTVFKIAAGRIKRPYDRSLVKLQNLLKAVKAERKRK
jgi:DNA-directed RNA polymerase specialized sigma24 family protein